MAQVLPSQLMNSVLGKLYDLLCNGNDVVPPSPDNYLAWCTPGIPMQPSELTFLSEGVRGVYKKVAGQQNNGSKPADGDNDGDISVEELNRMLADEMTAKYIQMENLSRLLDLIPDTSGTQSINSFNVWNAENTLSQAYEQILRFSQVADVEPDDRTKEKLEKLKSLMIDKRIEKDFFTDQETTVEGPSQLVARYEEYLAEYEAAKLAYNVAFIDAQAGNDPKAIANFAINGPLLKRRVSAAMNKWISLGYKEQFEKISSFIRQVEGRSITLMKQQYIEALENARMNSVLTGANFYPSTLIPGSFATTDQGWTEFSFTSSDYQSNYDYTRKRGSGRASLGFGLFRARAGGKYDKSEIERSIDTSSFELRFKLAQVPIVRPWFNVNFLTSGYWRFDQGVPGYKSQMASNGANPPSGMVPAFTTACIFVKDLYLKFAESEYSYDSMRKHASGRASVGWGPFSIGGKYAQDDFERNIDHKREGQGIRVDGMQLIGFKCHTLDKSPNPDTSIQNWV